MALLGSIIKKGIELRGLLKQDELNTPIHYQRKVLRRLLQRSQYTLFGQTYVFTNILKSRHFVNSFRELVPIHDYSSIFSKWWNKSLHEEDVCWPGKVRYFALSSGTSDSSSKHIPVTRDMVKSIQKQSVRQIFTLRNYNVPEELFQKGILMLGGSTHLHRNGSYFEGDLSGITASKIPFWFQHFYKPGKRISKETDWATKLEEITEMAPNWDIGIIVGVPAWLQLLLEKIIARYKLKTIHDIWPNLSLYVHGGVSFEPYRKSFEALLEHPLIYIETYLASEGFIAMQEAPNSEMRLNLNNGLFFEFIPFGDKHFNSDGELTGKPQTLLINEIKEGEEYALLISSNAGAWRYLIGDVIKFVDRRKCEIVITGRTKHYLSLCGEHLSVDNMNKAVEMVSDELNISIPEYTVAGIPEGNLFAHHWWIGTHDKVDAEVLKQHIDDKLKILNDDYRVERTSALREVYVDVVPVEVFYQWMEAKGKVGAQNKFPRVMKKKLLEEWLAFTARHISHLQSK